MKLVPQMSDKSYLLWSLRLCILTDERGTTVFVQIQTWAQFLALHLTSCVNISLFPHVGNSRKEKCDDFPIGLL